MSSFDGKHILWYNRFRMQHERRSNSTCAEDSTVSSPFPGMDPYLEAPYIWPDFHEAFAAEIRGQLNSKLPAPYYARLEMRPEVGIVEDEAGMRRIVPDVAVARQPAAVVGGVAVLDAPPKVFPFLEVRIGSEKIKHLFVEIRDPSQGHRLVTLIEIVSPSNKRQGPDRQAYRKKQTEVLASDASLVELDLLRTGERLYYQPEFENIVLRLAAAPDYLVLLSRSWQRSEGLYHVLPAYLTEPLPSIPVPLRKDQEVTLDLQDAMTRAYDSGPYRRGAVNYDEPPDPPLPPDKQEWLEQRLEGIRKKAL